jgi:hypothetical protein
MRYKKLCETCRTDGAMGIALYCPACEGLCPWYVRLFRFFCWGIG